MESWIRRTLVRALVLAPALGAGVGCADSESMLFIRQAQALQGQVLEQVVGTERAVVQAARAAFAGYDAAQKAVQSNTVAVQANLSLSAQQALNYGQHFATEGIIISSGTQYAAWTGFTDPGNTFSQEQTLKLH